MFQSTQIKQDSSTALVDMAPLIDVVFILLIFFLVTATFVKNEGINVTRPRSVSADQVRSDSLRVTVTASGILYVNSQPVTLDELTGQVRQFESHSQVKSVIVIPDETVTAGLLLEVIDASRMGGATDVTLATRSVRTD